MAGCDAMSFLRGLFAIEKKPRRSLIWAEWAVVAYASLTSLLILFMFTSLPHAEAMLLGRLRVMVTLLVLWLVYRLRPCRFNMMLRVLLQMIYLSWWYPDTYELNRVLPNLDHLFAAAEERLFGCQPALLLPQVLRWRWFSELMDLSYSFYFPMIALVMYYYFFACYKEFKRVSFIVLASFMTYYLIFILLPVAGPQYYYRAVGTDVIESGIFPSLGHYFLRHTDRLASLPWQNGFFHDMLADIHNIGERPTAAFPSSHVGISTILLIMVGRDGFRRLFRLLLPLYILLCVSTVYIRAHYVVDVIGGLLSAFLFYALFSAVHHLSKEG